MPTLNRLVARLSVSVQLVGLWHVGNTCTWEIESVSAPGKPAWLTALGIFLAGTSTIGYDKVRMSCMYDRKLLYLNESGYIYIYIYGLSVLRTSIAK